MLTKIHLVKAMVFPVVTHRLVSWHKEGWTPKNWCFQIVVLEKTLESPLDFKAIKQVSPKGNHSLISNGRTDAEAEASIRWPPNENSWLIGKDPDAGKDWDQEEKGLTEDEIVEWHHQLSGHEFEQILGDSEGQEGWHAAVHGIPKSWTLQQRQDASTVKWLNKAEYVHIMEYNSIMKKELFYLIIILEFPQCIIISEKQDPKTCKIYGLIIVKQAMYFLTLSFALRNVNRH